MSAEFWLALKNEFVNALNEVEGMTIPSRSEIERYYAARKFPETIEDTLTAGIKAGRYLYPQANGSPYQSIVISALQTVGSDIPKEFVESIPDFMVADKCGFSDAIQVIQSSIDKELLSKEFAVAWSIFNQAVGVLRTVNLAPEFDAQYFNKYIRSADPNIIQRHIYAYWMQRNWLQEGQNKAQAQSKLAAAILKELKRTNASKRLGMLFNILKTMIDGDDPPELRGKVVNMSKEEIERVALAKVIPKIELPDLE